LKIDAERSMKIQKDEKVVRFLFFEIDYMGCEIRTDKERFATTITRRRRYRMSSNERMD
jgi:hypothetical protein